MMVHHDQLLVVRTAPALAETLADFPGATGLAIAEIEQLEAPLPQNEGLIISSRYALAAANGFDGPLLCVGGKLAERAQKNGLRVGAVVATVEQLPDVLASRAEGSWTHLCGSPRREGWYQAVPPQVQVQQVEVYRTHYRDQLPPALVTALQQGRLTTVRLYSAVAAAHLHFLLHQATMDSRNLTAVCLSERVAAAWREASGGKALVAEAAI